MFENLGRTQKNLAKEIEEVYFAGMLPQSILFSGRKGTSRLTAALDLSFVLTGEDNLRSVLRSSHVMYIAARSLRLETMAALSLFHRERNDRSRLFLIQTIRKTLLQYHSSIAPLYENKKVSVKERDEEGRGGTLFSNAEAVDAILLNLEDGVANAEIDQIVSTLEKRLVSDFFSLGKKTYGASIDEIRAVQDWIEDGTDEKCVIIENPEDLTEGAKNSMLKMLEEPPAHSHIILLSEHPDRILQTILSRVRRFQFPELSSKTVSSLIGDIFSLYGEYSTFDDFFFEEGTDDEDKKQLGEASSLFSSAIIEGKTLSLDEENKMFSVLDKTDGYGYFRSSVIKKIEASLRSEGVKTKRIRKAWSALSEAFYRNDTYNMSIRIALDTALREAEIGK